MMEDELLCDAWLVKSVDFGGTKQGGVVFWQNVQYV